MTIVGICSRNGSASCRFRDSRGLDLIQVMDADYDSLLHRRVASDIMLVTRRPRQSQIDKAQRCSALRRKHPDRY
jgi:hypothetical protein